MSSVQVHTEYYGVITSVAVWTWQKFPRFCSGSRTSEIVFPPKNSFCLLSLAATSGTLSTRATLFGTRLPYGENSLFVVSTSIMDLEVLWILRKHKQKRKKKKHQMAATYSYKDTHHQSSRIFFSFS